MNPIRLTLDMARAGLRAAVNEYRAARFVRRPYVQDRLAEVEKRHQVGEQPSLDEPGWIEKRLHNLGA